MNLIHWKRSPEQEAEYDTHLADDHAKHSRSKYDYHAQQYGQITGNLDFAQTDMELKTNEN